MFSRFDTGRQREGETKEKGGNQSRLGKNDGLISVNQDSVLDVPGNRSGQDGPFDVATDAAEIAHIVTVIDPLDVLVDDWTGVEVGGDVVGGGADQFDAALVRLGVRIGADERGKEAVVDVDDPVEPAFDKRLRDDLHISGKHDEIDLMSIEQRQLP
jgi:hypothetical protein